VEREYKGPPKHVIDVYLRDQHLPMQPTFTRYPNADAARRMLDAVGDLCLAIYPDHLDAAKRERTREALTALVDEIIAVARTPRQKGRK
jgi:hypothetical protein